MELYIDFNDGTELWFISVYDIVDTDEYISFSDGASWRFYKSTIRHYELNRWEDK